MSKSAILVAAIGAFAGGALLDRFVTTVHASTESISAQIIHVPELKESDMGGTPGARTRSKNYVTVDGMTLNVQIGATSKHMHPIANEIQYIVEGTGKFWLGDKEVDFKPGDLITIPHGTAHGTTQPYKAIAIKSPVAANDTVPLK